MSPQGPPVSPDGSPNAVVNPNSFAHCDAHFRDLASSHPQPNIRLRRRFPTTKTSNA